MNELIGTLDATCVIFLKISAGVVLLSLASLIRKRAERPQSSEPRLFTNYPATVTAGSGAPAELKVIPAPEVKAPKEEAEPEEAPVQCGNCNNLIKTQPVGAVSEGNQVLKEYICEHCGMRVRAS